MSRLSGLLLIYLLLFAPDTLAANGSYEIKLTGLLAPDTREPVSVRDIEQIGIHTLHAYNPYEKKSEDYTGVWLKEFVAKYGASDVTLVTLRAIDGYDIEFSSKDWNSTRIMLVTKTNHHYMGFEHKGPLRIVFPDFKSTQQKYKVSMPKWMWMITSVEFQ